jgi:hypothetical protein
MSTLENIGNYTDTQIVGVYRKLRERRDAAKAKFVEDQKPMLEMLAVLEGEAKLRLSERGANSFSTDNGTCYTSVVHSFTAKNKTAFLEYVKEHDLWDLLDVRPAKKEVQEYLEKTKELPDGLATSSKVNTNFNAPRKK